MADNASIYIFIVPISIIIILGIILFFNSILRTNTYYSPKNIRKKMLELQKKIKANPSDYDSMYELANLEEQHNSLESALEKYKKLIEIGYFEGEEVSIYKKLEEIYDKLGNKEESFKYTLKISQLNVNDNYYSLKTATVLGREGAYSLACEYFNRILNSKGDFEIDELKIAALCYLVSYEYKKVISMLEELHKRLSRNISNIEEDYDEMVLVEKILLSLYVVTDEIDTARSFAESILYSRSINNDPEYKFYINRMYLYILYNSDDNNAFVDLYNTLVNKYKINNIEKGEIYIILDFAFYSYFIKDINTSINYFEHSRLFDALEFKKYDFNSILAYLIEISKANEQLKKTRNTMLLNKNEEYRKENYEKYVDKKYIDIWEDNVELWQNSFNNIDSILGLVEIEETMDIAKILSECSVSESSIGKDNLILKKVDRIYDITLASFKSICLDIIQNKLLYSAVQEYNEHLIDYNYGDEVNYLAFASNKNKKDLTLISFKRWRNTEVGELIIRDFVLIVDESGANYGILVLPVELTNTARSYALHNNKIKVYTRNQFNYMLRDSKF